MGVGRPSLAVGTMGVIRFYRVANGYRARVLVPPLNSCAQLAMHDLQRHPGGVGDLLGVLVPSLGRAGRDGDGLPRRTDAGAGSPRRPARRQPGGD